MWSTADGGMISQYADLDGFNQQWQLVNLVAVRVPVSSDITLQNLRLTNSGISESPCGTNTVLENLTLDNSQDNSC